MTFAKLRAALRRWIGSTGPATGRTTEADYEDAVAAIHALRSLFQDELDRREAVRTDDAKKLD